ncbi:unnamed protein product [Caenorhabditis bovis]|uniref:Uncharacterized protein n=1 Tax=Caenorhabditis bovis TaxID=2654633 RepID=A0A8S1EMX8_9PELO|nr:unnamed protein product [Caenorhabditis bovis]
MGYRPAYTLDNPIATNGGQIAVVFAILIGGVLLLAIVVAAIYFVCVANMRSDDKKRLNSGRNSASNWAQQQPQYREQPSSTIPYNPAPSVQNYEFGGPPRTPINNGTSYTPVPSATPYNQPIQYGPVATPTSQQYINQQNVPQYQPDVIFTQGPSGYVQQQPVEYTINAPASYHQSSV